MTPAQSALNTKRGNENKLNQIFRGGQKVAGSGRYVVALGKSKAGPCKLCQSMAGRHNMGGGKKGSSSPTPPYHPNCACEIK